MVARPFPTEGMQCIVVHSDEGADKRAGVVKLFSFPFTETAEPSDCPIKTWRLKRGFTAAHLSAAAGISEAYLSQLENGKRKGSVATHKKLAKALNIPLSCLL